MSVYVELVIFNNLAIDFLLIVATQIVRRRRIRKLRVSFAVLLGAAAVSACACWRSNCGEDMSCADYDGDFRYLLAI